MFLHLLHSISLMHHFQIVYTYFILKIHTTFIPYEWKFDRRLFDRSHSWEYFVTIKKDREWFCLKLAIIYREWWADLIRYAVMKIDHLWLTSKRPLHASRKYVFIWLGMLNKVAKVIVLIQNLVNALLYLGDMDVLLIIGHLC